MSINSASNASLMLEGEAQQEVDEFTYLGSIVNKQGGLDVDVSVKIGKARAANLQLRNWSAKDLAITTKTRIFNSNVKSVLLYCAEMWRTTVNTTNKIQTFINTCLRWPNTISNKELWSIHSSRSGSCGENVPCTDASETIQPPARNTTTAALLLGSDQVHLITATDPQRIQELTRNNPHCHVVVPARSRQVHDKSDIRTTMSL